MFRKSTWTHYLFSFPIFLLYTVFFIIPACTGIYYSLTNWDGMKKTYDFIGLANYQRLFTDARFVNAILFTLKYTILLVAIVISLSLFLALLLNMKMKGQGLFRAIFFFPAVLSLITVGLIFNQIFYRPLPMIGEALGISWLSTNILGNPDLAIFGILVTNIWQGVAMPTVIFLAGLQSVPAALYEAATMDGASTWQKFKSITLPFIIPMLSINLVLTVKSGLTVFDYITAMTGGGPGSATESIGMLIYKLGFSQFQFGYGAAQSIVLLLFIVLISVIQNKLLSRKEVGQQ